MAELARRYFTSRGPATVKNCADWSGLTMTEVRQGLKPALAAQPAALAETAIAGVVHYYGADADIRPAGTASEAGPRIDLIQCYDEYIMGYSVTRHYMGGGAPAFLALPAVRVRYGAKLEGHT